SPIVFRRSTRRSSAGTTGKACRAYCSAPGAPCAAGWTRPLFIRILRTSHRMRHSCSPTPGFSWSASITSRPSNSARPRRGPIRSCSAAAFLLSKVWIYARRRRVTTTVSFSRSRLPATRGRRHERFCDGFDVDDPVRRLLPHFSHAELPSDRASRLVAFVDARDDALQFAGLRGPVQHELARLLRHAACLCLGAQRAEQLEVSSARGARLDQSREAKRLGPLHDRE